jgi:hypothetical protein
MQFSRWASSGARLKEVTAVDGLIEKSAKACSMECVYESKFDIKQVFKAVADAHGFTDAHSN